MAWQNLQDAISQATGMAIITVDYKGIPVTRHSGRQRFCGLVRQDAELLVLLDTRFFAGLKAKENVVPLHAGSAAGKVWFFAFLGLGALFSGLSYMWSINHFYGVYTSFWPQTGPLTMGVWCALAGIFSVILMVIYYYTYGKKNGFSVKGCGVLISMEKIGKSLLLGLIAVCAAFLLLFFADYFFKVDFRLWVLTIKPFEADKVLIALRFFPLFLLFYTVNSVSVNSFNYNTIGGKIGNPLMVSLFNALGAIVFVAIQYGTFFSTGVLKWSAHEGQLISGIWLFSAIVYLLVTPLISRYIYKKTNNPYLGGFVNAVVVTMICCANTTTIIGGAINSAANTVA